MNWPELYSSDFTTKDAITTLLESYDPASGQSLRTDEAELPVPMVGLDPGAKSSLHDPRGFVEIIPWEELEPVSPTALEEAHIPIFLAHRTAMAQEDDP